MEPRIVTIPDHWAETIGGGKMLILTPAIIDRFLNEIPMGKLATVNLIREKFAHKYHTETTCPLTTGIFLRIVAGAAEEDLAAGKKTATPYWRILKEGGKLNPKYPGGVEKQAEHLRKEGFEISEGKSENSWRVKNFENSLITI
ncbi:MAG: hypothetical protein ACHQM6_01235 [Candidatus Kapaibacterium sp.]